MNIPISWENLFFENRFVETGWFWIDERLSREWWIDLWDIDEDLGLIPFEDRKFKSIEGTLIASFWSLEVYNDN